MVKSFKEGAMFFDSYENESRDIRADYIKGHVAKKETNSIHCHDEYEMLLIVGGEITYADRGGIIKMPEKSMVFTRKHDVHNPYVDTNRIYERYRIAFSEGVINRSGADAQRISDIVSSSYKKRLSDEDFSELLVYFKGMYELLKSGKRDPMREKLYLLSALVAGKGASTQHEPDEEGYVKSVIEYIKENYGAHLTCEDLASEFFVSRGKLIYDFKSYAGTSVGEYITITKIESAKNLLISGYSVAAVSEKCGFSSPSYFIKVFYKITGMTPLKYQIRILQKR